tara:strand:+ start:1303 stop:1584 length:282 start_codon:yes stop_codon:yes gene_type:complete
MKLVESFNEFIGEAINLRSLKKEIEDDGNLIFVDDDGDMLEYEDENFAANVYFYKDGRVQFDMNAGAWEGKMKSHRDFTKLQDEWTDWAYDNE